MPTLPIPLALSSDEARSKAFQSQRLINLYAEIGQSSKTPFAVYGTPGLKPWGTAGLGPSRGEMRMNGVLYVVSGTSLYSVSSSAVATSIGSVIGVGRVIMATNGTQLAIAAPDENTGYVYNRSTGVYGAISDPDFLGATSVAYLNGFFLWSSANGKFQWSALLDGVNYDGLDFVTAESQPDDLLRIVVSGSEIFLMGSETIELWVNTDGDPPFQRQTVISKGLAARHSPATLDNTLFWIGTDPEAGGGPSVYRMDSYTPRVISTPAMERALEATADITLVSGFAYKQLGHLFYVAVIPDGNTWVYDVVTGIPHERATYGLDRWLGSTHCYCYGRHLIGSYVDGAIYELDTDYFYDGASTPLVARLVTPHFGDGINERGLSWLGLVMETGMGLTVGQGSDPQVMMRYSKDGGFTWSNEIWRSAGEIGNYGKGVDWRRLGRFDDIVFSFEISDPVKRAFMALWGDVN